MQHSVAPIPDERPLTAEERVLIGWMLEHATFPGARDYLSQLSKASVVARCYCGCASIDLAVNGVMAPRSEPISILADFEWYGPANEYMGAFVFARSGLLAGLELWSIDGAATPTWLPRPDQLRPIGTGTA